MKAILFTTLVAAQLVGYAQCWKAEGHLISKTYNFSLNTL